MSSNRPSSPPPQRFDRPAIGGTVSICFADEAINQIFAALLRAQGVQTHIIRDIKLLASDTRVITEPQYLPALPDRYLQKCLVVGNTDELSGSTLITLSRPLTEDKIERALARFLQ